jgi:hypothetical protein
MLGREMHRMSGNHSGSMSIDVSEFLNGSYILKIQQGDEINRHRFVKSTAGSHN